MSLYSRLAKVPAGARALSAARLRYEVLSLLHSALQKSGISQSELAERLGVRKSAVNQVLRGDGNVRISTLADYLHALDFEVELRLVPVGKPREDAVRELHQAWVSSRALREPSQRSTIRNLEDFNWRDIGEESRTETLLASRIVPRDNRASLLEGLDC